MFNFTDFKVGTKLNIGFGIVLFFVLMLAINGLYGISKTIEDIENSDDVNRMVKHVKEARISEKNYSLRHSDLSIQSFDEMVSEIHSLALETKRDLPEPYYQTQMDLIIKSTNDYSQELKNVVKMQEQSDAFSLEMLDKARLVEQLLSDMREDKKADYEYLINNRGSHVDIKEAIEKADDANRLIKQMLDTRRDEKNFTILMDSEDAESVVNNVKEMKLLVARLIKSYHQISDIEIAKKVLANIELYNASFNSYVSIKEQIEKSEEIMLDKARESEKLIYDARKYQKKRFDDALNMIRIVSIAVALLSVFFCLVIRTVIVRIIVLPLQEAVRITRSVSDGDLSITSAVERKDEFGDLLTAIDHMTASLREIMTLLTDNIRQIATASEELSSVAKQTSDGLYSQGHDVEQVATAITEMSATASEVANRADFTSQAAQQADTQTKSGNDIVVSTLQGMETLAQGVRESSEIIHKVKVDSENITSVLDVIKNIADQTNLLALNAAIEAARAGEHGRGFAVVADEVRSLAQKTQDSTIEVEELIDALKVGADNAVGAMDSSQIQVKKMVDMSDQVNSSLESITQEVSTITEMNIQIATAAKEQSNVAEEVGVRMNSIQDISEQSVLASKQTSEASSELAQLGDKLQSLVMRFRL